MDAPSETEDPLTEPSLQRWIGPGLIAVLGIGLTLAAAWWVDAEEERRIQRQFQDEATLQAALIQTEFIKRQAALRSFASFYRASDHVRPDEFGTFSRPLLEKDAIVDGLLWAPRVKREAREAHEARARERLGRYRIRELDPGEEDAEPERDHFPVLFARTRHMSREGLVGFDLASHPMIWNGLATSRDEGEETIVRVNALPGIEDGEVYIGAFHPVYSKSFTPQTVLQRRSELMGFVGVIYRPGRVIEEALRRAGPVAIDVYLIDYEAAPRPRVLHAHRWRRSSLRGDTASMESRKSALELYVLLELGNKRWELQFVPSATYLRSRERGTWVIAIIGGLAATGLLFALLASLVNRNARIAEEVDRKTSRLTRAHHDLEEKTAALQESEKFLNDIVENIPLMVFVKDAEELRFQRFNRAGEELLGYRREELLGRNDYDFFPEEQADHFTSKDREVLRNRRLVDIPEERIETRDGERILHTKKIPILDDEGEPTYLLGISQDITERKEREKKLQKSREELREAKEKAEEVSRIKSRFLANMSHDIRTPMNGIVGFLELLLDTDLDEGQREYVELIFQSTNTLLQLLNDILDLSKLEAGELSLEETPFRLCDVVGGALQTLAVRAAQKDLELTYRIPLELPYVRVVGDPLRLRQIVDNLVGNAIKFTETGTIFVNVTTESKTEDEIRLCFEVEDSGPGIRPEDQEEVFEAFQQVKGDIESPRGTGLGLTIAAELVAEMGGRIDLQSELGEGTTFRFTLPFGLEEVSEGEGVSPEELRGHRVLVVDDTPLNRRLLREFLEHWGMDVDLASNGVEALRNLRRVADSERNYDLILLDQMMPGRSGVEVAEAIRQEEGVESPPLILMSSAGVVPIPSDRIRELGIARNLSKPVRRTELLEAIADALMAGRVERREREGDGEAPATEEPAPGGEESLRILLVEDDAVNQRLARILLEKEGHEVQLAETGREAVRLFEPGAFDLILMDVRMPEMDGIEATREIRRVEPETDSRTPIIAMTAHAMKGDRERCIEAGMDDYVSKPIKAETIRRILAGQSRNVVNEQVGGPS